MIKIINILQRFEDLVIKLRNNQFLQARTKLIAYHMLSIVFILAILNFAIFFLFSNNFIPENNELQNTVKVLEGHEGDRLDPEYIKEEALELLTKALLTVDLFIFLLAFFISFFSTKKILQPVEEFSKKQEKFAAHAAHELRTPLAVMKAGAEIFSKNDYSEKEYKKFIFEQLDEINSLIKISNNLLLLVKTKKDSRENFGICDLDILAKKQVNNFKKYAFRRNIIIKNNIQKNVKVFCNSVDMEMLFNNLLKNAIDYNFENGKVEVKIFKKNKKVFIVVENTGAGIAKSELKYIFDNFFKSSNNTESNESSSGLGLSIVKEIVLKHGGKIDVFSDINKETRFHIQLPENL